MLFFQSRKKHVDRLPDKPTSWLTGQSGSVRISNQLWKLICASGYNTGYLNNTEILTDTMSTVKINSVTSELPNGFRLMQNFPNPFNPSTAITYQINSAGLVSLKVFDLLGKEVAELVNEFQSPGTYSINFEAGKLNSGVYFYRLRSGDFEDTKRLALLK